MVTLVRPQSLDLWNVAAELVDEYAAALGISLDFQDFGHERAHLADEYGPPTGAFLLAEEHADYLGCGAIREWTADSCEMKRLYVRPRNQNRGVGRLIAASLIEEARRLGYRRVLLDTLPSMRTAQSLYRSLGFRPVDAYRFNPVEGTTFLALDL